MDLEDIKMKMDNLGFGEDHLLESIGIKSSLPNRKMRWISVTPHITHSYIELVMDDGIRVQNMSLTFEEAEKVGLALIKLAAIWKEKIPNTY